MFTLLNELHFWTFRSEIAIRDTDFGAFCYYEKRSQLDYEFLLGKKSYCEQRGIVWSPSNKRPSKLRDSIRELEECLDSCRIVSSQWKEPDCLLIILSSGLLISIKINILTGDLEHIHFDKHLVSKLSTEHVSDVAVGGSEAVFALGGGRVLAVHYAKSALKSSSKHWVTVDSRASDLVVSRANDLVANNQTPSLRLRLSFNSTSDKMAVWWERDGEPWQQVSSPSNYLPIHIYHFSNLRPEPACCLRTEAQPVLVTFSHIRPNILHIVVQIISTRGEVWLGWCQMDISSLRGDHGTTVQPHRTVPLHSHAATVALSPAEDKLLIACFDSTLIVADYSYDYVVTNKTNFGGVTAVAWHPDSCIVVAGDDKARIQFFDSSLSPIRAQFITDQHSPSLLLDIGAYFRHQPTLLSMTWNKKPTSCNSTIQIDAFLFLHFERGPLGVLKLVGGCRPGYPVDSIVCHYLAGGAVDRAVSMLSTLSWDSAGSVALACLQSIVNYLLIRPLTPERCGLLEKAVGSYFDCKRPISRITCLEFNDSVTDIRRKIFHHLLRYQVCDKAFKLAVELGHYDLLMDVHHQAKSAGSQQLASAALERAEQISEYSTTHSRSSVSSHSSYESTCSWCSRSSCSQCQDEEDKEGRMEDIKEGLEDIKEEDESNDRSRIIDSRSFNEESSSQASSKTSLLQYHSWEEMGKGKVSHLSKNNKSEHKKNPQIDATNFRSKINGSVGDQFKTHHKGNSGSRIDIVRSIEEINEKVDKSVRIKIRNDGEGDGKLIKGSENELKGSIHRGNSNAELNGRTSAEFDRDCLVELENGTTQFELTGELNGDGKIDTYRDEQSPHSDNQWPVLNGGAPRLNGIKLPSENILMKNDVQDYLPHEGKQEVHSSLWGKDRVHVQHAVGDQWSGSPVRVAIDRWSHLAAGRGNWRDPSTSRDSCDLVRQETCSDACDLWSNCPTTSDSRRMEETGYGEDSQWKDPIGHMSDLQKESCLPTDVPIRGNEFGMSTNRNARNLWAESQLPIDPPYKWREPPPPSENRWSEPPVPPGDTCDRWLSSHPTGDLYNWQANPHTTRGGHDDWVESPSTQAYWTVSPATRGVPWSASKLPPADLPSCGPCSLWTDPPTNRAVGDPWIDPPPLHSGGPCDLWPKPYLGPRNRPPPPPPPRPKVKFSESVTHITLPLPDELPPAVEGNINTVGLPDTELPGYPIQRRHNPGNKTLDTSYSNSNHLPNQGNSKAEDNAKVKVVHFGLV